MAPVVTVPQGRTRQGFCGAGQRRLARRAGGPRWSVGLVAAGLYVRVCTCVRLYVPLYIRVHLCVYVCTPVWTRVRVYILVYIFSCVCIWVPVYVWVGL